MNQFVYYAFVQDALSPKRTARAHTGAHVLETEETRNVTSRTSLDFASGSHVVLISVDTAILLQ